MRLDEYESREQALRMSDELLFSCENGHTVTVYSSDPHYPDWVDCPDCDCLMERGETDAA